MAALYGIFVKWHSFANDKATFVFPHEYVSKHENRMGRLEFNRVLRNSS